EVIEKVGNRPGGYTRIIKTGYRLGDNAEMCIIELVDFNELMLKDAKPAKKTTRRSRRGSGKAADAPAAAKAAEETAAPAEEAEASATAEAPEADPKAEEGNADASEANDENKKGE